MQEYESYDALGLADLVRRGEVKPNELLDAALARMERLEPKLHAVTIPMIDDARAALEAGLPEGPFTGVPFLIKDLHLYWEGVRTSNGCAMWEDYVADHDSELVERYRAAGLVTFGKSASPEFGLTPTTESALFGATNNPWKEGVSPGGSSGGAGRGGGRGVPPARECERRRGVDPASQPPACGLFGMKPTRGRTPMGPSAGEGWAGMSCIHAVSRSVRDNSGAPRRHARAGARRALRRAAARPALPRGAVPRSGSSANRDPARDLERLRDARRLPRGRRGRRGALRLPGPRGRRQHGSKSMSSSSVRPRPRSFRPICRSRSRTGPRPWAARSRRATSNGAPTGWRARARAAAQRTTCAL